jgi:hypothetical protein
MLNYAQLQNVSEPTDIFEFNLFLACCMLYDMKTKFVCSSCGKEIPKGLTPLKCGDNFFDDYHCLDVFVAD